MQMTEFIPQRIMRRSPNGFALITSMMVVMIITALGLLAFTVTTRDMRMSSVRVGEKKAFSAAESGINWLAQNFNPDNVVSLQGSGAQVDPTNDPQSLYNVNTLSRPTLGPESLPLPGYSMVIGTQPWGQNLYFTAVSGANTRYNSNVQVEATLGFGPVELMTTYR